MLKKLMLAMALGGALLVGQGIVQPEQAEAKTYVYVDIGFGVGVHGPYHWPPYYYVPPYHGHYHYRPVRYTPRWKWRCRKKVKRVRYWHRRHGHWHYKTVRKRVCHRVRVW